ncbi:MULTISPECIES: hypothetical protein [Paenibacillus]|uniref:Uncharacterized protein n=1 Tax=Paenibacillus albilobatus TaxID=2716884 RepID=A0A920CBT2_9BACL|nr:MULTISPECIES: hypothetical protein [Paenibacillus]GIO33911.1 hypothetical protein J2TS6_50520 [Paenibacillus albilobatus]
MIKLLKYDLRRNANLLLAVCAVLILCELAMILSPAMPEVKIAVIIVANLAAAVIFMINNLRVFDYNIKSVSRRLLPVNTLSYVWASLIYGILNTLSLIVIGGGAGLYFFRRYDMLILGNALQLPAYVWLGLALEAVFTTVYGFLLFYVVIALARSITKKGAFWVGLLLFLVLSAAVDWLENLMFREDSTQAFKVATFHYESSTGIIARDPLTAAEGWRWFGSFGFELLLSIAFLFVIKWCVEKRIEAR